MNILIMGPQGSGKGTQARILCDKFGLDYFESGAYLRKIGEEHPEIKRIMDEGNLVPDKEFTSYLTAYLDQEGLYDGIVFDGFPRTVSQYEFLKNWLTQKQVRLDLGIILEISEEETISRLSARRQDPATGKIYNLVTDPPPPGFDQSKLVQRDDDKPAAIKKRLALYKEQTEPLITELGKETEIIRVNGSRPIDIIARELDDLIQKKMGKS
jgi:adenylate kinase